MACKILSNNFALIAILYYAKFDFLTESAPAMKINNSQ